MCLPAVSPPPLCRGDGVGVNGWVISSSHAVCGCVCVEVKGRAGVIFQCEPLFGVSVSEVVFDYLNHSHH